MYWKRWMKEYLPLLTLQNKWTKHCKNMKIGDIAILKKTTWNDRNGPWLEL